MKKLQGRQLTLIVVLIISVISTIVSYILKGAFASFLVGALILLILFISKKVWLPEDSGKTHIRSLSLWAIVAVVSTNSFLGNYLITILFQKKNNSFNIFGVTIDQNTLDNSTPIPILLFVLIGIFIVNYFNRDRTAMGVASKDQEKEFPEISFKDELLGLRRVLENTLRDIDIETSWSDEFFVPLEAEVEIKSNSTSEKRVTNLLSALKSNNKDKAILVLGDPGSGKSVALRKLSKDLLQEVSKTGKIPLYVNLREWNIKASDPKILDLQQFILENVKDRCDVFASEFLDKYFDRMVRAGRVFFVLDSFDEIPHILDENESSPLIDKYSAVIYNFLDGSNGSRGILASRVFRKPTQKFKSKTIFEIRPFSEDKILQRFEKSVNYNLDISRLLFRDRPEFVSLARNPFTSSLIFNYAKRNSNTLPANRMDLYENYISQQLELAQKHRSLGSFENVDNVFQMCSKVAYHMYQSKDFGLEIPLDELKSSFPNEDIELLVEILLFIRLGRLGSGEKKLFSFVHRRFNEFFIALKFSNDNEGLTLESIPADSRWRDALVLYCEITNEARAREIANYCWKQIEKVKNEKFTLTNEGYLASIHALRFLSEAFKARKNLLDEFYEDLAIFIEDQIDENNILISKLFVESTGILKEEDSERIIRKAFSIENPWVSETAMRSCRNLPKISIELEKQIRKYILSLDVFTFFNRKKEFIFSFSLSDGFKGVYSFCKKLKFETNLLILGLVLSFVVNALLTISMIGVYWFLIRSRSVYEYIPRINLGKEKFFEYELDQDELDQDELDQDELDQDAIDYEPKDIDVKPIPEFSLPLRFLLRLYVIILICFSDRVLQIYPKEMDFYLNILSWIAMALVFPFIECYEMILGFRHTRFRTVIGVVIGAASFFGIGCLFQLLPVDLKHFMLYTFVGAVILTFIIVSILTIVSIIKDKRKLSRLNLPPTIERRGLYELLSSFETVYGRGKIISRIEAESISIYGEWPEEQPPKLSVKSAIVLAQLEEKKLGFNR